MEPKRVWIRIENLPKQWVEELQKNESRIEIWHGKDEDADPAWLAKVEVVFTDASLSDALVRRLVLMYTTCSDFGVSWARVR
jgi:hypothetical protein